MNKFDVDRWIENNEENDAYQLLDEKLPKMRDKLNRLDKKIRDILAEVKKEFPDACYYTASGGFNLMLGSSHDDRSENGEWLFNSGQPMEKRMAWGGSASIGDGDF